MMLRPHPRATQAHSTCRVRFRSGPSTYDRPVFGSSMIINCCCLFSAPKNEDAYEISIPYEEGNFEQQGFFSQSDQNFDGEHPHQYFKSTLQ